MVRIDAPPHFADEVIEDHALRDLAILSLVSPAMRIESLISVTELTVPVGLDEAQPHPAAAAAV
jgi:hypothetical protein